MNNNYTTIEVDINCSEVFLDFSKEYPELMIPVKEKAIIGNEQLQEFIVTIGPPLVSALSAFFVAKLKYSKGSIHIKKGDFEFDLSNVKITPEKVEELLKRLEKKEK